MCLRDCPTQCRQGQGSQCLESVGVTFVKRSWLVNLGEGEGDLLPVLETS